MASIRQREDSKFWFACVTLPNGRRVQGSAKETVRKKAQKIADQWEAATRGRVTARQTQKVIADLYRDNRAASRLSDGPRILRFVGCAEKARDCAEHLSFLGR